MSYEKVDYASVKKDGSITVRSASSNVVPAHYNTWTYYDGKEGEEGYFKAVRSLFDDMIGYSLQFNKSSRSRVYYAFLRTLEFYKEKYGTSITDLWVSQYDKNPIYTMSQANEIENELFDKFLGYLDESKSVNMSQKAYCVLLKNGRYLYSEKKYSYQMSMSPKYHTINTAMYYAQSYQGEVIKKKD